MDDQELSGERPPASDAPAFDIRRPAGPETPLIFASPHSGRLYPDEMMTASRLGPSAIRRSEDVLVDRLIQAGSDVGATLITARYARAYIDMNRDAYELDQTMFEDELPPFARAQTPRVAAGLGAIARVVAEGQEIYARKLSFAEARRRIDHVHRPYHAALADLLATTKARFGSALLIDWHSMPSAATRGSRGCRTPDFVLGDRFGASCRPGLPALVDRELRTMGYEVARNTPYAGGYTTEFYGDPAQCVQVLQIEINRALYLDEAALEAHGGFAGLERDLAQLFGTLALNWAGLV